MLEVMQFIFSSFWVYLGTLVLVICVSIGIGCIGTKTTNNYYDGKKENPQERKDKNE